jgi:hypothetical protein
MRIFAVTRSPSPIVFKVFPMRATLNKEYTCFYAKTYFATLLATVACWVSGGLFMNAGTEFVSPEAYSKLQPFLKCELRLPS